MTLAEFLEANDIRGEDFAKTIGVSQAYVSMLCHRKHDPSLSVIMRIKDATGGQVEAEDLVSLKTEAALATSGSILPTQTTEAEDRAHG